MHCIVLTFCIKETSNKCWVQMENTTKPYIKTLLSRSFYSNLFVLCNLVAQEHVLLFLILCVVLSFNDSEMYVCSYFNIPGTEMGGTIPGVLILFQLCSHLNIWEIRVSLTIYDFLGSIGCCILKLWFSVLATHQNHLEL